MHAQGEDGRLRGRGEPRLRRRAPHVRPAARRRDRDALGDRGRRSAGHGRGVAALSVFPIRSSRPSRTRATSASSSRPRRTPRWRRPIANRRRSSGAILAFPEAKDMWSLTAAWGGFGGMDAKDWRQRKRSTAEMYGDVYGVVSQVAGAARVSAARPAAAERRPIRRRARAAERSPAGTDARDHQGRGRRRLAQRKVPVRRHRPEDRPAASARGDRSRAARGSRPRPRRRRRRARDAARRRLRQPVQLLRPQLQGHPADRRRGSRHPRSPSRPQDEDAGRAARAGIDLHSHRDEHRAAHVEPLPAAQRRAGVRRRRAARHQGAGAARAGMPPPRPRPGRASSSTTRESRARFVAKARP